MVYKCYHKVNKRILLLGAENENGSAVAEKGDIASCKQVGMPDSL